MKSTSRLRQTGLERGTISIRWEPCAAGALKGAGRLPVCIHSRRRRRSTPRASAIVSRHYASMQPVITHRR
jgi:hypothetical protein